MVFWGFWEGFGASSKKEEKRKEKPSGAKRSEQRKRKKTSDTRAKRELSVAELRPSEARPISFIPLCSGRRPEGLQRRLKKPEDLELSRDQIARSDREI